MTSLTRIEQKMCKRVSALLCSPMKAQVPRGMWRRRTRTPKWKHVCTIGRYDVKDRCAQKAAWWLTRKRDMRAGNQPRKIQRMEGEISIVQSIQLGFSRSIGSATSNAANKSAMLRAEWTIAARRAVLCLAQMKCRYFVRECCKHNAIFSDTSHQDRTYLDNVSTNRWFIVCFQQRHCSR